MRVRKEARLGIRSDCATAKTGYYRTTANS